MKKAYSYIRYSSKKQELGASLQRQLEASRKYAREHDLDLDESLRDLGVSSFHGLNRLKGAFGSFLQRMKEGKITVGSVLIVENLDRLSREHVSDALEQFINILNAGITIVTLMDNMEYSKESVNNNWTQFVVSISIMAKARGESKDKSDRLKDTNEIKRNNISPNLKFTGKTPLWIEPNKVPISDTSTRTKVIGFKPVKPEWISAINLMFDLKLEGKGKSRIAKILNNTEPFKSMREWNQSYVEKVLTNRAVIGEFQPHKIVDEKREPVGDPIPDYFPIVVTKEKFYQVQATFLHKGEGAGRNDKLSNLFAHMAVCGICHSPMQYVDKGYPNGQYFVCKRQINGIGCDLKRHHYDIIEENILTYWLGLDVSDLLLDSKANLSTLALKRNREQEITGEISDLNTKIEQLTDRTEKKGIPDSTKKVFENRIAKYSKDIENLIKELKAIQEDIRVSEIAPKDTEAQIKNIQELFKMMKELEGEELLSLRLNLRGQLRRLIKEIRIHSQGIGITFESGRKRYINLIPGVITKVRDRLPPSEKGDLDKT